MLLTAPAFLDVALQAAKRAGGCEVFVLGESDWRHEPTNGARLAGEARSYVSVGVATKTGMMRLVLAW